jgi:hypothetical protein
MTTNYKRLLSVLALIALLVGCGYLVSTYLYRSIHQASISVGETFPALMVSKTDTFDHPVPMPRKQVHLVIIVRNGCKFCDSLEQRLEYHIAKEASLRDSINLYLLSLDDAPKSEQYPLLTRFRYVYDGKDNNLFFSQTPQIYLIDRQDIVRKKYLGVLDTADISALLQ